MDFGIGSAFSKGPGSAFSEGPGPDPGPLYKICLLQDKCPEKGRKIQKSPERKRLQPRSLPVNFANLLRTPFLQNTDGGVGVCLRKCLQKGSQRSKRSQKGFWMASFKRIII